MPLFGNARISLKRLGRAGLGALLAVGLADGAVAARSSLAPENVWAAEHINALPPDMLRAAIGRAPACGNVAAATQYFSTSITVRGRVFRSLHFEDFACDNRAAACNASGCLHEIYLESHGRYRLVFGTFARDLTMSSDRGAVMLEVSGGPSRGYYQWNGLRFLPAGRDLP